MDTNFDTLSGYITLAKKTISKFGPKFYNGLSTEMLTNEDAVSDVATAIMYADWRYDDNRTGKTGLKKTKYSYRNQCAIWAIKTYISHKYKKGNRDINKYSLDHEFSNDKKLNEYIEDSSANNPLDILIEAEQSEILSQDINYILNLDCLTEKQRDQIKLYYFKGKTLAQIGNIYSISREAVRQNIKRALDIIREYDQSSS